MAPKTRTKQSINFSNTDLELMNLDDADLVIAEHAVETVVALGDAIVHTGYAIRDLETVTNATDAWRRFGAMFVMFVELTR